MVIRAAFIGIDRYQDPGIRDLTGAARDARALWAVLSDSVDGLEAPLIVDADATLAAVTQALDDTLGAADSDDVVLLTFAGHGTPDHRLVVADTLRSDLTATSLDMGDLAQRFKETKARAVVLLLDCCFSGGAPARVLDGGFIPRDIGKSLADIAGKGRVIIAASSPDQEALEDPLTRHGLFTKAVVECLLKATQPVSVLALANEVITAVRTQAEQFGFVQTPVIFGHVEGELVLPSGQRGARYSAAFPEATAIQVTADFSDLASYGIPSNVLNAWRERFPSGLNSLQLAAVNDHAVLTGQSLLVVAPTSAGKTFVGEMAALKAITEGRKAVFLLPFKALVNEKFEDFSALYGDKLDLRVARCSGDWQDQVPDVLRGKYDLAFFTYEKFLSLAISSPHILNQIGLVVLDEAQFITESGRGMTVELLLTSLISARRRGVSPQLITLSAVIGGVNSFDRWLGCDLLTTDQRPVPLVEGVMDRSGTWQFLTPAGVEQSGQLLDRWAIQQRKAKPESQDMIVPLVQHLVANGEKIIVFRNNRGSAAGCAQYLADALRLPPAQAAIDALPVVDPSSLSPRLRKALEGGVAFHHSDLNREERIVIEQAFRNPNGGVSVLVATSTVAAGINTPASTVIVVETAFRGADGETPYTVAQYKNMAGRAGRLGYETEGKAIVLADTGMERNAYFRRYIKGKPEQVTSSFNDRNPGTWLMKLLAQVKDVPRTSVVDLVINTYGGYLATLADPTWRGKMSAALENLLSRMQTDGLIEQEGDIVRLTMLGRACGESPLTLESAMRLVELLRSVPAQRLTLEYIAALVEALPERDEDYTPQLGKQGEATWQQLVSSRFGPELARALRHRAASDRDYYARCKRALIVRDWIEGEGMEEIERRYSTNPFFSRVGPGDVRGFAEGTRFILEAAIRISGILLGTAHSPEETERLLKRLELGIPAAALDLTTVGFALNRGELLALWRSGVTNEQGLCALSVGQLQQSIGQRAEALRAHLDLRATDVGSAA